MGRRPPGAIGTENMADLLADAREDDDIKTLVLRVDSGGGSVLASHLIRGQVQRVQAAGKPVVVSMARTAASGGYWIAATTDEIWAAPTTITGSIGVFAILPTIEESMRAVGVIVDGVATGPLVGAGDPMLALSEPMRRLAASQHLTRFGVRHLAEPPTRSQAIARQLMEEVGVGGAGATDLAPVAATLLEDWRLARDAERSGMCMRSARRVGHFSSGNAAEAPANTRHRRPTHPPRQSALPSAARFGILAPTQRE